MKKTLMFLLLFVMSTFAAMAQMPEPVKWSASTKQIENNRYLITFKVEIESPYHIYDMGPYEEGTSVSVTKFTFSENKEVELVGTVKAEQEPKKHFDESFGMEIGEYEGVASFTQEIKTDNPDAKIKVMIEWQACGNGSCLPPAECELELTPKGSVSEASEDDEDEMAGFEAETESAQAEIKSSEPKKNSLWGNILAAIVWAFAALATPCVFPMIPMTVSFFLKSNKSKAQGKLNAMFFWLFIVVLYTLPIAIIVAATQMFGGDAATSAIFNWLATHWLPNLIFFLVFMVFAASFFGAFELVLPSSWVNKSDANSDKAGLKGVFFMALTLVLVSFSCTGPIVGSVITEACTGAGVWWEPIVVMFAFSSMFAIPFAIFAFSPSLLKEMPKSGGWLNVVKVVLGFIELALGLKFLSAADQAYHWGILDREIYVAIWIVIFVLLGCYLLGKLKFAHDSEVKHITVTRLLLAIASFTFALYMLPGMWGAPLKAISGYIPPMQTQDFVLGTGSVTVSENTQKTSKYSDFLKFPPEFQFKEYYFTIEEAMNRSKEIGKPIFVDFTGHSCPNCREMEQKVWSDPRVKQLLTDEFIVVALYGDDKTKVAESDWVTTEKGKVVKELGKINQLYMLNRFGQNGMPLYFILDHKNEMMTEKIHSHDLNVDNYLKFLNEGLKNYKSQR